MSTKHVRATNLVTRSAANVSRIDSDAHFTTLHFSTVTWATLFS